MADHVHRMVGFALGIDEQPARQIERGGIGEELIEIGVGHAVIPNPLVLGIADERTDRAVPPREVRPEIDAPLLVERDNGDAAIPRERTVREAQGFAERQGNEVLEYLVHVPSGIRAPVPRLGRSRWSRAAG